MSNVLDWNIECAGGGGGGSGAHQRAARAPAAAIAGRKQRAARLLNSESRFISVPRITITIILFMFLGVIKLLKKLTIRQALLSEFYLFISMKYELL
jgi:hypothetical protein